jgi:hypothetical protein
MGQRGHCHRAKGINTPTMSDANGPGDTYAALYRRAFELFGTRALWNRKPVPDPTPEDALAITHSLRVEGNLEARRLAERIEAACRAAL